MQVYWSEMVIKEEGSLVTKEGEVPYDARVAAAGRHQLVFTGEPRTTSYYGLGTINWPGPAGPMSCLVQTQESAIDLLDPTVKLVLGQFLDPTATVKVGVTFRMRQSDVSLEDCTRVKGHQYQWLPRMRACMPPESKMANAADTFRLEGEVSGTARGLLIEFPPRQCASLSSPQGGNVVLRMESFKLYVKHVPDLIGAGPARTARLAPRPGFEPGAYSLGGSRSIHLSYRGRAPGHRSSCTGGCGLACSR